MTYPAFNSGDILTATDMNNVGMWLVNTCTVTSAGGTAATASNGVITVGTGNTSVSISNAFSSSYKNYLVKFTGGVGSVGGAQLRLYLNVDTANNYYSNIITQTAGVATVNGQAFGALTGFTVVGYVDTGDFSCSLNINNPNQTKNTNFYGSFNCLGGSSQIGTVGGWSISSAANTGFTFATSSGTMTGGTICVYGYND